MKRNCRSTVAGETTRLVVVLRTTDCIRSVLLASLKPSAGLHMRQDRGDLLRVQVYTGTKFSYAIVVADTSWPQHDRLWVDIARHLRKILNAPRHSVVLDR